MQWQSVDMLLLLALLGLRVHPLESAWSRSGDQCSTFVSVIEKSDGFGSEMLYYLSVAAIAHQHKWNWGGIYSKKLSDIPSGQLSPFVPKSKHHVEIDVIMDFLFGNKSFFISPPERRKAERMKPLRIVPVENAASLSSYAESNHNINWTNFVIPSFSLSIYSRVPPFTKDFLKDLQCDVWSSFMTHMEDKKEHLSLQDPSRHLKIVAHMRLGDQSKNRHNCESRRVLCEDFYLRALLAAREVFPTAHILIQTSTLTAGSSEDAKLIQMFRQHGMDVHMDDESSVDATADAIAALTRMATADILFVSHSAFPYVAALLNPNCVVNAYHLGLTLQHWLDFRRENSTLLKQYLSRCIRQDRQSRQLDPHDCEEVKAK